jgi:hypothetical protein
LAAVAPRDPPDYPELQHAISSWPPASPASTTLFYDPKTALPFGDAKALVSEIAADVQAL